MKMRIKYFEGAVKLEKITKGNWIDVYANKTMFIPEGTNAMVPLGFALELPKGWEGRLAPRSSTYKTWGIIQTNSMGIVDDSYIGDNDEWCMPVYCLNGTTIHNIDGSGVKQRGTHIFSGDKIGQFRIMEVMPEIEFEEVEEFGNADRGGFGSTGTVKDLVNKIVAKHSPSRMFMGYGAELCDKTEKIVKNSTGTVKDSVLSPKYDTLYNRNGDVNEVSTRPNNMKVLKNSMYGTFGCRGPKGSDTDSLKLDKVLSQKLAKNLQDEMRKESMLGGNLDARK